MQISKFVASSAIDAPRHVPLKDKVAALRQAVMGLVLYTLSRHNS